MSARQTLVPAVLPVKDAQEARSASATACVGEVLALNELQLDALGEAFNIALGAAAEAFSGLVHEEVELSVPAVELLPRAKLLQRLKELGCVGEDNRVCAIRQRFEAQAMFATDAVVVFPESGSVQIVRRLLGAGTSEADVSELEEDTLAEIGNVILNACLDGLGGLVHANLNGGLPDVQICPSEALFQNRADGDAMLIARIGMHLAGSKVSGYVLLLMDCASIQGLVREVERAFDLP